MTTSPTKTTLWLGSIVLMASVAVAVFYAEPLLIFSPVLLMAALLFVQHPHLLFYTLIVSLPWSTEVNFSETYGTDLPDEPLMLLMAFAVVVLLLSGKKIEQQQSVLLPLLLLGFAWAAITVCVSTNFLLSTKYFLAKGWYLLAFVGAPLVMKWDEKLLKRSAVILFCSMFIVTCVSLIRHATWGFTFIKINDALAPFFRNHVNYSALLVFMVPLQLAFYQLVKTKWLRIAVLFSLLIVLTALVLSYARGAWLALIAGMISYWLIKKGWLTKAFLFAIIIVGGFIFWLQYNDNYLQFAPEHDTTIFHENFGEHLMATYKGKDVSTAERFYRWVAGARMSKERWLTGFGPTTFYQEYKAYTIPLFRTWVSDNREGSTVHNYFLLLLIEQGVLGLLFFLFLVGAMFWKAQRLYQRASNPFWRIVAATIASVLWMQCTVNFLSDLIETDKIGSVFYLCLSFLIIADAKQKKQSANKKEWLK